MDPFKNISPKEYESRMKNDAEFRNEMIRRQNAAVRKMEAVHRELGDKKAFMSQVSGKKQSSDYLTDDEVFYGGRCSSDFITTARVKDLLSAVKNGRLSETRFKMEMRRRKNKSRYEQIPSGYVASPFKLKTVD